VHLIFVDDSTQKSPTRPGFKGKLVAAGGLIIHADQAKAAEQALREHCRATGFPPGDEFKWSPDRQSWMYSNLRGDDRSEFQREVISILAEHRATACVVMEDDARGRATGSTDAPHDVLEMLFERVATTMKRTTETAVLIADSPPGDRPDEYKFVAECLESLDVGTQYVQHDEIAFVLTSNSKHIRLLQAADLITSCMTAYVAGEPTYSQPMAMEILRLCPADMGNRGGWSVKIHPDHSFGNLYHWLLSDKEIKRGIELVRLPQSGGPYFTSPDVT
jgi:hypothetical protein